MKAQDEVVVSGHDGQQRDSKHWTHQQDDHCVRLVTGRKVDLGP